MVADISEALAAADGTSQAWNEVYQHPRECEDSSSLERRFALAQKLERRALASGEVKLNCRAECGLSRAELDKYVNSCGLDVDVGTGSLILALNALDGVSTLSSCSSFHEGAHEKEALVAFTVTDEAIAHQIAEAAGDSHFRESQAGLVRVRGGTKARFHSYILYSDALDNAGNIDASQRFKDLMDLATRMRGLAGKAAKGDPEQPLQKRRRVAIEAEALAIQWPRLREHEASLRACYEDAKKATAAGHALLESVFKVEALEAVRDELVSGLRGLRGVETKESCALVCPLIGAHVGGSSSSSTAASTLESLPRLAGLVKSLGSDDFIAYLEQVTGCKTLERGLPTTASLVALPRGGFWLPQVADGADDGGGEGLNFVFFLVEDWWSSEDGGAIEVYGPQASLPSRAVLPCFNSLLVHESGLSTAATRVLTERAPQLCLHGTFRAAAPANVTADQKLTPPPVRTSPQSGEPSTSQGFSDADRDALRGWVAARYLRKARIERAQQKFAEESYLKLPGFLCASVAQAVSKSLSARDSADGIVSAISEEAELHAFARGVDSFRSGGWEVTGPASMRRYLSFATAPGNRTECNPGSTSTSAQGARRKKCRAAGRATQTCASSGHDQPSCAAGTEMTRVAGALAAGGAFARYLEAITGLQRRQAADGATVTEPALEVRRFRPGLDYARGAVATSARLDAVLCLGGKRRWRRLGAADVYTETAGGESRGGLLSGPEGVLPRVPLLRLPPASNTLRVVLRDTKTEHSVEPIAPAAGASRWDICTDLEVDLPPDDDESGGSEGECIEEEGEEEEADDDDV